MKRKLIASFVFDLGKSETTIYSPCVNVYWDIEDEVIKFYVRYAWQDFTIPVSFYQFKNALKKASITDMIKHDITERTSYRGEFELEESYYMSDFGKAFLSAESQEQVVRWIKKSKF